jgi:hypothetical protein
VRKLRVFWAVAMQEPTRSTACKCPHSLTGASLVNQCVLIYRHTFQDHGVCFSSGDGCGGTCPDRFSYKTHLCSTPLTADCFDDSDFTRRAMPEKRSIRIARDDN